MEDSPISACKTICSFIIDFVFNVSTINYGPKMVRSCWKLLSRFFCTLSIFVCSCRRRAACTTRRQVWAPRRGINVRNEGKSMFSQVCVGEQKSGRMPHFVQQKSETWAATRSCAVRPGSAVLSQPPTAMESRRNRLDRVHVEPLLFG